MLDHILEAGNSMPRFGILTRLWLSTAMLLTVMFGTAAWVVQRHAAETALLSHDDEVAASFQAYESVWRARQEMLGATSQIISSLPNVRAAFGTRDMATIRDSAAEVWESVRQKAEQGSFFIVTDLNGTTIASLDSASPALLPDSWPVVSLVRDRFPQQLSGFFVRENKLFQLVLTPVYVDSSQGRSLINVLLAGYPVTGEVAARLKKSTGGSDFVFQDKQQVFASTLSTGSPELAPFVRDLVSLEGKTVGQLSMSRSFDVAQQRINALRRNLVLMWFAALLGGLIIAYFLARRLLRPIQELDRAAAEIARSNYSIRVPADSGGDELGRLGATFNSMSESLQSTRQELIRQERISTIGRLASSIVHDLRNPLAAIYGGAEMMVDAELSTPQMKRLAGNIYQASRRISSMLEDLLRVSRGKQAERETSELTEILGDVIAAHAEASRTQNVSISLNALPPLLVTMESPRIERVFHNMIENALEMMPSGGSILITACKSNGSVEVTVEDTGPGISPQIRDQLFQPFVSFGKKNGLGLGLALSRQTILEHSGDMWATTAPKGGACFHIRLPLAQVTTEVRNPAVVR